MGVKALFKSFISPNPEDEYAEFDFSQIENPDDAKCLKDALSRAEELTKKLVVADKVEKKKMQVKANDTKSTAVASKPKDVKKLDDNSDLERM